MLIKRGQKFQVVGVNRTNHSYYPGVTYEATKDDLGNGTAGKDDTGYIGNTITEVNYKIVGVNRDSLIQEISYIETKRRKELAKLRSQVDYLDETKKEEFDEMEYKCYQAIKSLNSSSSDLEKAMLISKLIKGEI